jgi:hypothetical protein
MLKIIPPDSWDFGEAPLRIVKAAASGFRGADLTDLVKRSDAELADWVKRAIADGKKLPGELWAHAIAMGSDESVGPNRNADHWLEEDLRKDAHTFETHARAYRQHANSDPKKSYGIVKKAHYNDAMRRVELILAYNATKEAAERHNGLVADKEIEDLESNRPFDGSMSVKISHDVCRVCHNHAKTRADYCTDATCSGGGMKKHAGRTLEDGRTVSVSNHGNRFFDFSRVHRHADRTAAILGKVASHVSDVVGGAELAERLGLVEPAWLLDASAPRDVLTRIKLARDLAGVDDSPSDLDGAFRPGTVERVTFPEFTNDHERAWALTALAHEKVALSLADWLILVAGPGAEKAAAEVALAYPVVRRGLADEPNLSQLLRDAIFPVGRPMPALRAWAAKQASHALEHGPLMRRLWLAGLRPGVQPPGAAKAAASPSAGARELARRYLAYQVSFLDNLGADDPLAVECLARMGRAG